MTGASPTKSGGGERVVRVHRITGATGFLPRMGPPAPARDGPFRSQRRGDEEDPTTAGPVPIAEQAACESALVRCLGSERARVAGHFSGGRVALRLARVAAELAWGEVLPSFTRHDRLAARISPRPCSALYREPETMSSGKAGRHGPR